MYNIKQDVQQYTLIIRSMQPTGDTYMKSDTSTALTDVIVNQVVAMPAAQPLIIGIDGKDASGKTTFANTLADALKQVTQREVIRVSLDDFFLPRALRARQQDQARGCYEDTFDIQAIITHLLRPLKESRTYTAKMFDHATDSPVNIVKNRAASDAIIVIDGVFLQRPAFKAYWDYTVLLDVADATAIERGSIRDAGRIGDIAAAREKYVNRYIASQKIYYDECLPQEKASIVVDNTDFSNPKIIAL